MQLTQLSSRWVAAKEASRRVLLVLHGRGDSYEGFTWLPEALGFPAANYLMVNAPDPYYTGYSWYDLPPNQQPGIERSRALLDQVCSELAAAGYPTSEMIVFGFSQGCLMALEWGARTQHPLAGLVGVSGYCYDAEQLARDMTPAAQQTPWLITHGTADDVLPFERTSQQVAYLQGQGLPLEFHAFAKTHTIDDRRELPLIQAWLTKVWAAAGPESRP